MRDKIARFCLADVMTGDTCGVRRLYTRQKCVQCRAGENGRGLCAEEIFPFLAN